MGAEDGGMIVDVKLNGLDEVIDRMNRLSPKVQWRIFRTAARRAMVPVRDDARRRAQAIDDPATRENIAKNLDVQVSLKRSRAVGGVVARVGIRGGAERYASTRRNVRKGRAGQRYATGGDKSNPGGDTWYWRFIELGTSRQAAHPFLRPALEGNAQLVADTFAAEAAKGIDKALSTP